MELKPTDAAVHQNLGVALAQQGKAEGARALEEAVRLRPDYTEAFYNLGNVLQGLGRRDQAVEKYREAVRLRPKYGEAYNNLGLLLTEAGRHGEAAVVLQQAVRLRPQAVEGHNNLGLAYTSLGRFAEAEACFREALRLDPGYVEGHNNLGSAYEETGAAGGGAGQLPDGAVAGPAVGLDALQTAPWPFCRAASTRRGGRSTSGAGRGSRR